MPPWQAASHFFGPGVESRKRYLFVDNLIGIHLISLARVQVHDGDEPFGCGCTPVDDGKKVIGDVCRNIVSPRRAHTDERPEGQRWKAFPDAAHLTFLWFRKLLGWSDLLFRPSAGFICDFFRGPTGLQHPVVERVISG